METLMPPHDETLLIVDDEQLMTDVFRQFMTKRGFRVLTAASGEEALRAIEANSDAVDLIITDMTMPEMDGTELARRIYTLLPLVPVMIASGHDLDPIALGVTPNVVEVVRKPYQNRRLAERIREILDQRKESTHNPNMNEYR